MGIYVRAIGATLYTRNAADLEAIRTVRSFEREIVAL